MVVDATVDSDAASICDAEGGRCLQVASPDRVALSGFGQGQLGLRGRVDATHEVKVILVVSASIFAEFDAESTDQLVHEAALIDC